MGSILMCDHMDLGLNPAVEAYFLDNLFLANLLFFSINLIHFELDASETEPLLF